MRWLTKLLRLASFVLLSVLLCSALTFYAPGYFAEAGEMDASHAGSARLDLEQRQAAEGTFAAVLRGEYRRWSHGDLGRSRQYDVPVGALLRGRALLSAKLLLTAIALGRSGAMALAILVCLCRSRHADLLSTITSSALLGLPVGALATLCLIGNLNAPASVLAVIIGVRDFKLQHRALQSAFVAPHILQARASGLSSFQVLFTHVFPLLRGEWIMILLASFTIALSALVPVEVVFDLPGLGQLAWSAAMNRDMPVLVSLTAVMAGCVGLATTLVQPATPFQDATCAQ